MFLRIRNSLRNRFRHSLFGRLASLRTQVREPAVLLVSCTRYGEQDFWQLSALGRSLAPWRKKPNISVHVAFSNKKGLAAVYNQVLQDPSVNSDIIVFVHDDVWLTDRDWLAKTRLALHRFDIVGVAGNKRRTPGQPAWLFRALTQDGFIWDHPHLSGQIRHGPGPGGEMNVFGPTPSHCELLDGVFLAIDVRQARRSHLCFDEDFLFHFYDMDFCRLARSRGLSLGTWPIDLTHQSSGSFGSPDWRRMFELYRNKWRD